ncbi:GntR family transcriptional regulator [Geodermatophilus ruber]|uniref:GntR family transcriptional regulator n=1 Tax=Geodermatophilus ruber TaxID=504800 RepID=UPI001160A782|nr:GntR family transcriptional regulator [Geodermatophilus ruber]
MSGLPGPVVVVAAQLSCFAADDDATDVAMPPVRLLAEAAQIPARVVRRALSALVAAGWVALDTGPGYPVARFCIPRHAGPSPARRRPTPGARR